MSNQYATIKTGKELEAAIKSVRARRRKLETGITADAKGVWNHYKPSNLVSGFVQQYTPLFSWTGIGLAIVRGLKKRIAASAKPQKEKLKIK